MVIRKYIFATMVVFGLGIAISLSFATQAIACGVTKEECNRNVLGITFEGTVVIKNPIEVTVCHGYWDQLDVGTLKGRATRHWGPVMVYNGWYGDLPIASTECKTYWVRPGTEMRLFASCVDRIVTTGVMRKPGTYTMK